eukprot:2518233-Pyramimonas_sp.AAC.1
MTDGPSLLDQIPIRNSDSNRLDPAQMRFWALLGFYQSWLRPQKDPLRVGPGPGRILSELDRIRIGFCESWTDAYNVALRLDGPLAGFYQSWIEPSQ